MESINCSKETFATEGKAKGEAKGKAKDCINKHGFWLFLNYLLATYSPLSCVCFLPIPRHLFWPPLSRHLFSPPFSLDK
jgi:hypothetical protein